ncbi:two pore domain potassium channel family protein [Rhodobacteraceae bacterium NNCM2]|nr:two pore domain potassium channel family protein [Coraliihabitans acroporae]
MTVWHQIALGSVIICVCALCHTLVLTSGIDIIRWVSLRASNFGHLLSGIEVLVAGFLVALTGHTIQVWVWAFAIRLSKGLSGLDDSVYFALVTTTTLGYGDITLGRDWRVFGAMASVSGLLTYGLSTAFLIGLMERMVMIRMG